MPNVSQILVVTGETSGERHLAGVVAAANNLSGRPLHWFGTGGPALREVGAELLEDVSQLAAIGPWEAVGLFKNYLTIFRRLLDEARRRRPRLAVLVDFPEFNLRLAPRLQRLGIPVCYFIGPQVWAWRPHRIELIRRYVDRMLVIFPFEEEFYRRRGVEAVFVGNPTFQELKSDRNLVRVPSPGGKSTVALMPGSRRKEIERILPIQLEVARLLQQRRPCSFWVIQAPGLAGEPVAKLLRQWRAGADVELSCQIRTEPAAELLPQADCAIIKSGTSTLEAMILGTPFAMIYRMSKLSYSVLRPWVRSKNYCLANLVAGRSVVPEFVQGAARPKAIADYLDQLLSHPERMRQVKQNLRIASERLGRLEAYPETAKQILNLLAMG